jgi:hypothetical protein
MSTQHTPGPWRVEPREGYGFKPRVLGERAHVCEVGNAVEEDWERWDADARLIAAAPDMLEALRECVQRFASTLEEIKSLLIAHPIDEMQDDAANQADEQALDRARTAIAKATGAQP